MDWGVGIQNIHELRVLIGDPISVASAVCRLLLNSFGAGNQRRIGRRLNSPFCAQCFELYMGGLEIANAYDELADSQALRARFEQDNALRAQHQLPLMPIDEHLLAACDAMPRCSGIAVGIDRLLMVITGAKNVQEVIPFPSGQA